MKYIGARYMPKFVGTYDATTSYEALSVVDNGMGTSYVSNKPVPAGTPLTDTNYWAVYGASSGAILDLQNRVSDIETFDAKIENSTFIQTDKTKAVFFGDSLTLGDMGGDDHIIADKPYPTVYGELAGIEITNKAAGGSTAANNPNAYNPTQYLQAMMSTVNLADYDQMFIAHGVNDYSANTPLGTIDSTDISTFYGALNNAVIVALTNNPKIEIIFITSWYAQSAQHEYPGAVGLHKFNDDWHDFYDYNQAIKNVAAKFNLRCVDMVDAIGINKYNYSAYLNDDVHMNQDGYTMVGYYLAKQLSFPKADNVFNNLHNGARQTTTANMVNIVDFTQDGVGGFDPHRGYKCGPTVLLTLGGTDTAISKQKYYLVAGIDYSFHCNLFIQPGLAITIQVNDGSLNLKQIAAFSYNQSVNGVLDINTRFTVSATTDYRLDIVLTDDGAGSGYAAISDISMSEGIVPVNHELGNNFINNTFWKEKAVSVGSSGASVNATCPFKYWIDNGGTVHLQGQIDCTIAPNVERSVVQLPMYFTPLVDCYFPAVTTAGVVVVCKMNVVNGYITILPNADVTAPYTIDFTGITFSAIKQNPLIECPIVES